MAPPDGSQAPCPNGRGTGAEKGVLHPEIAEVMVCLSEVEFGVDYAMSAVTAMREIFKSNGFLLDAPEGFERRKRHCSSDPP